MRRFVLPRSAELPFPDSRHELHNLPERVHSVKEWLLPLWHAQVPFQASNCLIVLHGHPLVFRVGLHAATDRALAGEPVLYLDGAHAFDPFVIGRLARAHRQLPRRILSSIHVARTFTCHQMERLVSDCLGDALARYQAGVAVVAGPFETFYDEAVPAQERLRLAERMVASLRRLARQGYAVLCLCPPPPSGPVCRRFLDRLCSHADRVIRMGEDRGAVRLEEEGREHGQSWKIARTVLAGR
jgi:hypothetical protein